MDKTTQKLILNRLEQSFGKMDTWTSSMLRSYVHILDNIATMKGDYEWEQQKAVEEKAKLVSKVTKLNASPYESYRQVW